MLIGKHAGKGSTHAIGELTLDKPLDPSALVILRVQLEQDGNNATFTSSKGPPRQISDWPMDGHPDTFAMQRRVISIQL